MGCHTYTVSGRIPNSPGAWADRELKFSESDDQYGCLCTFPHNYEGNAESITSDTIRSLAMLGALVVLAHQGSATAPYSYVPFDVPDWIRERIDLLLPVEEEA